MKKILTIIIVSILSITFLKAQEYIPDLQVETLEIFDSVNMNNKRITDLADPIDSSDAVNFRTLGRNTSTLDSSAVRTIIDSFIEDSSVVEMRDTLPIVGTIATRYDLQLIEDSLGYFTRKTSGFMGIVPVTVNPTVIVYPGHMARSQYVGHFSAWYDYIDENGDTIPMQNAFLKFQKDSLGFTCTLKVVAGWLQYDTYDTTGVTLTTGGFSEVDPVFTSSVASNIDASDTTRWSSNVFVEIDPIYESDSTFLNSGVRNWNSSLAKNIDGVDTTRWGLNLSTPYPSTGVAVSTGSAWSTSYTTTGSGVALALSTSPTLITPVLGVAAATSINKVRITAPATSSTLTINNEKTFTASNTLTLSGTDNSTLNVGTGGTLGTAAYTATTNYEATGNVSTHAGLRTGVHGLNITAAKTLTVLKNISITSADDAGVYTFPTGTKTLLATDGSAASLTSFPTLNQSTTGSAASLTTSRSIYGNSFNGTGDLTQIIASTYGGTGSGFTKFTGATTSEKVYTLPDANATLLYSGGSLIGTTIQANTGLVPDANDGAYIGTTSLGFSDLFLATGGVINWANGEATITETTSDVVTVGGADLKVSSPGNVSTSVVTTDATQTLTNKTITAVAYNTTRQTLSFNATSTVMNYSSGCDGLLTLTGNITGAITLSNVPDNGSGTIYILQNATGGYGIASVTQSGLTTHYINSDAAPIAANIRTTANELTVLCYKRVDTLLVVTYGKF